MRALPGVWKVAIGSLAALLVGVQAVRVAAVEGLGGSAVADRLWPTHARRVLDRELTSVGTAAGRGQAPSAATLARINAVSLRDPLAAQPFLVAGTAALAEGQRTRGARLLAVAVRHDPRDPGARLLLANLLLENGDLEAGMVQVAVLARLLPGGARPMTPALAAFARQPGNAERLAPLLNQDANLRGGILEELAGDPANARAVLQLAGRLTPPGEGVAAPSWQGRLVSSLIAAGRFGEAREYWTRFTGKIVPSGALTDPAFRDRAATPPFGWTLASGSEGSAEPDGQGGLQILYYGRNDVVLASQLATLSAGTYRLSLQATSGGAKDGESLAWSVTCVGAKAPLGTFPLRGGGTRAISATFRIPDGCPAQSVSLNGIAPEFPSTAALRVSALRLEKLAG